MSVKEEKEEAISKAYRRTHRIVDVGDIVVLHTLYGVSPMPARCPTCKGRIPANRDSCPHCGRNYWEEMEVGTIGDEEETDNSRA